MATNPSEKQEANKNPPPLFGGGLFGNPPAPGTGFFGNAAKPGLGGSLFGAPSPSSAPTTFSPAGQQQPITPLFGNTSGQPQSAPSSMETNKAPSLFSGGLGALGASKPAEGGQNKLGFGLFGQGVSNSPIPSFFGPPKTAGQPEQPLATSFTPANPAPTTTTPLTLSFGSTQQPKKEEPAKKNEAPSLFGSSGASTGPLFGGTSLFGQAAKPAEGDKKDQKKPALGSLFGGLTSSVTSVHKEFNAPKKSETPFGLSNITPTTAPTQQASKAPPSKAPQVKETPAQQIPKNPLAGSLFSGNPSGSLFGASSSGSSAPSLFGGVTPTPLSGISPVPTTTPAPSLFQAPTPKAPSLFGGPPTGSLFGAPVPSSTQPPAAITEKPKPAEASSTLLSQSMPKPQKPAPKQSQQGLTLTSKTEGSGKPQPPKPAASTLLSNDSKQPKKDGATMPSLFGGSTAIGLFSNKPTEPTPIPPPKTQPLSTASQPKPIFQSRPDTALPSLTERRRKEPAADPEQSQTIRSNQSAESSVLTKEKTHNDFATRQSKNTGIAETADTGNGPKLFSFLKPRQANTAELLDFKALMQERDGEMFSTFLSQSSKRIISSIKLYFTVRREPFKPKEQPPNNTQKERFFFDFANLFMKVQGLSDQSYPLVGQFLKRVISDQRYERLLFKDGALSVEYFRNHMIYQVGLGNTFFLNQAGSRELQFLVERMVNKWNVQRVGILNFLLGHSDLMKKPSDLFSYLFRHLLQMDGKHIQTQNKQYSTFIKDFEYLTKKKLLQVIAFYNGRLREFKLIPPEQIKGIVMLLQSNKDEAVNEVALKVLLNSLNFKQPKEIPGDVFQAIRQTKSECMMPLRALAHKLTSKRHDFVPPPKELYKYIRGDQWVDWFDIYLSDSGRQGVQLQTGEAEQILQSLCSISGPLLLQRMMDSRKGLQRFFNLLRDQNMVTLYYRLLQACVYDEKSITKVNQFYFQKMHFNLEYQQVIEYVIAFNQQQPHANEEVVLAVLEVKLGLLAKIIQVAPEKLVELERFLFYHDYNRHKKFRANVPQECPRAQGEKLVHLFLDTVNIVSLKGIPNRILHRIFRVLAHLLRSQQTQEVALTALRTNRPSFAFLSAPLHPLTLNAINSLLEQVLSGHYLHDLAADYAQAREDEVRSQSFYPFRYRDAELGNLMRHQTTGTVGSGQFSIYWMNQLVRVVAKQRFNPQLLFKMLQKLHIEPYSPQGQAISGPFIGGLYQKRSLQNRIPTIFEPIVSVLNQVAVWEQVARVLQYKIVRCDGKLQLANKLILTSPSLESERTLLFTLKLVRLCFQLNTLLGKYQQSADSHFVVRTLSAVNFLSRGKIGSQFATNASRNSILLSLVALLHLEGCQNDGTQGISWQAEQAQEEDTAQQALIQFLNRNRQILDFQQASNFLRRPTNSLYEAENSIVGVSLQVMLDIIRLSPQCSLEHSLTTFLPLKEDEKTQLKVQVLNKLSSVVAKAVDDPRIDYRIIDFLYHLKYDCGMNKLHGALSNRLFDQFLKSQRKDAERSVSFKSSVTRYLMKELSEGNKNYQTFTEQFLQKAVGELRFRDTILRDGRQFKEMREVGKMVRNYHSKEHSLLSLNQLERMVEERAIVEIGRHMQTLSNSIDILMGQLIRRKHSQGLLNCLCVLNHLILAKNLLLLEQDLPDSARTRPTATNSQPRLYLRDPLQAYISQGGVGKHGIAQLQQKNNIVEWLLSRATTLSNKITSYFMFILTIDRYLYANNPVSFTVDRPDIVRLDLFCHLALGSFNFTATELFGKNSTDAVETVQGLASNLLGRLTELTKGQVREGGDETYRQGLRMVGYCLQWLRGKEKHGETASQYLIRKLQKNFQVLLPSPSHFLTPQALKVLLSALSMGVKNFSPEARTQVRQAVYAIVERYWQVLQRGLAQQERAIGELFQQAATVLILLPPEKNEAFAFELLVNIWTRERNFQFFFNESRLMIELARVCPQELVKLQPLTRCQIITALSPRYSRYSDDERRFDGVAWTWAMRVAAELANHPLSILVVSQVSAFLKKYRERIQALFENGDKLSKSYLQDLQVALQLLASLFSHDLWVNFNRKLAEEITYLLSHKLIRVFVLYAQGRLTFAPFSSNDKQLSSVKCLGDEESPFDSLTQETVFSTEMRIRLNYCLRNYCLVMSKAFRSSHYVETYFETSVLETSKYFSSFWDGFGKQLTTLFVYASKQFKLWSGLRKLNEALSTMTQCAAAPHSFVENGYLCTVGQLPRNDYELYSDLYLLNYLLTELAAVHLLKERLYVGRFNSLMGTHADAFAKRIREHVEGVRVESKRINVDMGQYVGETEFNGVVQLIQSARATK